MKTKICKNKHCLKEKPLEAFSKASREKDGYNRECKECLSIKGKIYYLANKEEINKGHREKYKANPEPVLAHQREYYAKNKDKKSEYAKKNKSRIRINQRKNERKRRLENPFYKIKSSVRSSIRNLLKKGGNKKQGSILNHLPYSIQELKLYLEDHFEQWMSWDNYGKYNPKTWNDKDKATWTWNIDHIIPQSDRPYNSMKHPNFRRCWDLVNLRPYPSKYNTLDGVNGIRHIGAELRKQSDEKYEDICKQI